jgi:uncharacterized protein (TIGR04255 family)
MGSRSAPKRREASAGLPDYGNPPVSEVACGIGFQPLKRFLMPYLGLYWTRIRRTFPTCEHANPYSPNPSGEPGWLDPVTGLPLPRAWFISSSKDRLIQLQGDCFFYNWRRLADDAIYPRYQRLLGEYRDLRNGFVDFLKEHEFPALSVMNTELTYVNHIPQEQGWSSPADLSKVFRDYCWTPDQGRFLPAPTHATWRMQFDMGNNNGTLSVSIVPGKRVKDQMPSLKMEISAKKRMSGQTVEETEGWFDDAHGWIVKGFEDLTQEKFQKSAWKKLDA